MAEKRGLDRFLKGARILAKILLLTVFYLAILCAPLLAKDAVTSAYSGFDANTPFDFAGIPNTVFNMLFIGFAALIGGLYLVNLVFRLIDEISCDTVIGRRFVQVLLNVFVILGGVLYLLYLNYFQIQSLDWWGYSNMAASGSGNSLLWGWAALYLACSIVLYILDLRLFAAENRNPWYRKKHKQDANNNQSEGDETL
jgi:glycosyltransferase involved in cell wall biosynthesis